MKRVTKNLKITEREIARRVRMVVKAMTLSQLIQFETRKLMLATKMNETHRVST